MIDWGSGDVVFEGERRPPEPEPPRPKRRRKAPHNGVDTSKAAAEAVDATPSRSAAIRMRILELLLATPSGLIAEEIQAALSINGNTARPRLDELRKDGLAYDSPTVKRPTQSGCPARVWFAVDKSL